MTFTARAPNHVQLPANPSIESEPGVVLCIQVGGEAQAAVLTVTEIHYKHIETSCTIIAAVTVQKEKDGGVNYSIQA